MLKCVLLLRVMVGVMSVGPLGFGLGPAGTLGVWGSVGVGWVGGDGWRFDSPSLDMKVGAMTGFQGSSLSIFSKMAQRFGTACGAGLEAWYLNQLEVETASFLQSIVGSSRCSAWRR